MCQSVWAVEERLEIRTARELAKWLDVAPEELITADGQPMTELDGGDWRDACLCPFDVPANLDAAMVFYRRALETDPMMYLASKSGADDTQRVP